MGFDFQLLDGSLTYFGPGPMADSNRLVCCAPLALPFLCLLGHFGHSHILGKVVIKLGG